MSKATLLRASRLSLSCTLPALLACSSGGSANNTVFDLSGSPPDRSDLGMRADAGAAVDQKASALFWVKQLGKSDNEDVVKAVGVDGAGNVYAACQFSATTDFGDGPRQTRGNYDVALVKLTAAGEFVWARQFGDTEADTVESLAVDGSGNVILAGTFNGSIDFGGGPVNSRGREDFYVVKYSGDGRYVWGRGLGTDQSEASWLAPLRVDAAGNVYLAATWGGSAATSSIDLGGGPLATSGYSDGFLVKYDPSGAHVFSKRFGGPYHDYLMALALAPSGEIVIGGQLRGTVNLGGGPMTPAVPTADWAFIARLDNGGVYKSAIGYYSNGSNVTQLAVDAASTVTAAGTYRGVFQTRTTSLNGSDAVSHGFLLQLDASGSEKWARAVATGSPYDVPGALVAGSGSIYLGGVFQDSGDFGLGKRTAAQLDAYVVAYDSAGVPQWVRQYSGPDTDSVYGLSQGPDALYVGGRFTGTVDFGGTSLTAKKIGDGFLLKMPPVLTTP